MEQFEPEDSKNQILRIKEVKYSSEEYFSDPSLLEYFQNNWIGKHSVDDSIIYFKTTPPKITLRYNILKYSEEEALQILKKSIDQSNLGNISFNIHSQFKEIIELWEEKLPKPPIQIHSSFILIDKSCSTSVLRGSDIFSPAIMASSKFKKGMIISVFFSQIKYNRGTIIKSLKEIPHSLIFIGNGIAEKDRKQIISEGEGVGIKMTEIENLFPFNFQNLDSSVFFAQNLPSVLVGHCIDPKEGELILDMCSAPGGKSVHMATLAQNNCKIISIDKSKERTKNIVKNAINFGINCISAFTADSTKLLKLGELSNEEGKIEINEDSFDKILLDPSCSGLGLKPRLSTVNTTLKEIQNFSRIQRALLQEAVCLLKPGGILVYSTCTITAMENEEIVRYAIDKLNLCLCPIKCRISNPIPNSILSEEETQMVLRIDISDSHNGFFISKFIKPV